MGGHCTHEAVARLGMSNSIIERADLGTLIQVSTGVWRTWIPTTEHSPYARCSVKCLRCKPVTWPAIPFPICFSDGEVRLLELKSHQAT